MKNGEEAACVSPVKAHTNQWITCTGAVLTHRYTCSLEHKLFVLGAFSLPCKTSGMQRALKNCASYSSEVELPLELSYVSGSDGRMSGHFELT